MIKKHSPGINGTIITSNILTAIVDLFGQAPDGFVSSTHFWDPDLGDNSTFTLGTNSYTNAYRKARKYFFYFS